MASRALPVSKLRERRKRRRVLFAVGILLTILVVASGVVGILWMPQLRIEGVEVVGASTAGAQTIEERVGPLLAGTYAYILPKDNIFLFPQDEIQKLLLNDFPTFQNVAVNRKNLQTIRIEIIERKATAIWCGESSASPCYLLDTSGNAYTPAADFSDEVYVKFYGPLQAGTSRQFMTPEAFLETSALVEALRAQTPSDQPRSVTIKDNEVTVAFESGFTLLYMVESSAEGVLERFSLTLSSEPFKNKTTQDFLYVDLRFGDKLYYKPR